MKYLSQVAVPSTSITTAPVSAAIDGSQLFQISVQAIIASGTAPTGSIALQVSNDVTNAGNLPTTFTPTNWTTLTTTSTAFSADGTVVIPKTDICYRWVRVAVTFTSGTGTISAQIFGVSV